MDKQELQRHFESAIELAFKKNDSVSFIADTLVRALATSLIHRSDINEAYDRNDI